MITPLCRFTYCNVFEPKANLSGALKYSCGLLFPKTDTAAIKAVREAIDLAIKTGINKGTFSAAAAKSSQFKYPLRDGDEYYEMADDQNKGARESFRGCYFLSASSNNPVGIVDKYARPIIDSNEFYSGCWGHADIRFFPFSRSGNMGIGVGLQNVMKKRDDDRLDGKQSAEAAFRNVAETASEDSF